MKLQIGMRVLIKNKPKDYLHDAGKIKRITHDLPNFGKHRCFALDGDQGMWCIEDFVKCVDYPHLPME